MRHDRAVSNECTDLYSGFGNYFWQRVYRTNRFRKKEDGSIGFKPENEWGESTCPAIVSAEMFETVKRILEERHKPANQPGKQPVHIFAGLLRCACGGRMYVYSNNKGCSEVGA